MPRISKRTRNVLIAVLATLGVVLGITALPSTGADFNDSQPGRITATTAVLGMSVNGNPNVTFELAFGNIKPGDSKTATFTVKNVGTIPGDVSLDEPVSNLVLPALPPAELAKMKIGVNGYAAPAPITSLANGISLGWLNGGQERTYTVVMMLDQSAGNVWQDQDLAVNFMAWINQRN